jgi:hypothetical protein
MECTPSALPFSGDGISLAALRLFLSEHKGKDFTADARWEAVRNHASAAGREPASSFETLSVGQVSLLLLGHGASGPSYVQRLQGCEEAQRPLAAPATVYVVCCWEQLFVRFAESLLSHFEGAADADSVYLWICARPPCA